MLVLPFFMDASNICISGWQHSFTSLHFMHLWFNFWCFFRPTQMLHPNLVYFGHLSWVHSLHFEVEKSLSIPIPWNVYLKLPIFSIQFFYQLSFISHFILKLLFFKKNPKPSTKHFFHSPSSQNSIFLLPEASWYFSCKSFFVPSLDTFHFKILPICLLRGVPFVYSLLASSDIFLFSVSYGYPIYLHLFLFSYVYCYIFTAQDLFCCKNDLLALLPCIAFVTLCLISLGFLPF